MGMKWNCKHSSALPCSTFSMWYVRLLSWFVASACILHICSLICFISFPVSSQYSSLFTLVHLIRQVGNLVCVVTIILLVHHFVFLLFASIVWCNFVCYVVLLQYSTPAFFFFLGNIVVGLHRFGVSFVSIHVGDMTTFRN